MIGYGHPLAPQVEQALLPFVQEHISGLILSNGTDADHDIDISAGATVVRDGAGGYAGYEQTGVATIAIDNAGDRVDGSSLDTETGYNVLVGLQNGALVQGFSKVNALPSGWSHYRRIGSVRTEGTSNLRQFTQDGDHVLYHNYIEVVDNSSLTDNTFVTANSFTPPNVVVEMYLFVTSTGGKSYVRGGVQHPDAVQTAMSLSNTAVGYQSNSDDARSTYGQAFCKVDENSQFQYISNVSTGVADRMAVNVAGYWDDRGRND